LHWGKPQQRGRNEDGDRRHEKRNTHNHHENDLTHPTFSRIVAKKALKPNRFLNLKYAHFNINGIPQS
jgi:hypothetical protein